jgi:SNF2 family DNA or RNA helicase
MVELIVNENFNEEFSLFEKEEMDFCSPEFLEMKKRQEKISSENEIDELLGYRMIKKNLAYDLPYQRSGAMQLLKDLNSTALLADEVGLGKTITAGLVLKEGIVRGFIKKCLILAPPSLVTQWVQELRDKFELKFNIIESAADWDKYDFAIASIDRVKIIERGSIAFRHRAAHFISWDLVLVDEAHKLKERNTVRWKFVDRLQKKRFLLLTATPFQNDLIELYNLLHLLKKGHLGTIKEFRGKFLHKGNKRVPINPEELKRRLDEVMVRRKRTETGIDYKKRIPKIVIVELTPKEKMIYDNTVRLLKENYFRADGNEISGHLVVYAILPKITSSSKSAIESLNGIVENEKYHSGTREFAQGILDDYSKLKKDSKIEALLKVIDEIQVRGKSELEGGGEKAKVQKSGAPKGASTALTSSAVVPEGIPPSLDGGNKVDEKILIYTRHPTTLRYIVEKLKPYNFKIIEFLGGLSLEEKAERIDAFKGGEADILISTDTGAEGLNFQFCRNLINYDLPWNPMSVEQRIGRLDRIGQKRDMYIYSLATKGTMEEYVVDLIVNKMCCVGMVIGELPIILFNLGLDSETGAGRNKIEERLMNVFIDSKGNLDLFSQEVEEIAKTIQRGLDDYIGSKKATGKLLD